MTRHAQLRPYGIFDAKVPRYTSYPAATQFSTRVGVDQMSQWVSALPEGQEISLYLHIPFCRRLCWFCACRTQGTRTLEPLGNYLATLKSEIAMMADALPRNTRLNRLHWGGGTPTLLSPDMIRDLGAAILDVLPLGEAAEFSVEIDPNEIGSGRIDALAEIGMNRASIGVQDFDPEIQEAIGRPQSYEATADAVSAIRAHGVASLNMDILFGLPYQTQTRIADSVQKVLALSPDRVALYGYAHVPWVAKRQVMIPSDALPTPEERLDLFETARDLFLADGYEQIGIDHFARPGDGLERAWREGRLHRNFQGYTDDTSPVLIGLGASSISRFPQGYAQNAPGTSAYQRAIQSGSLATCRGYAFTQEDRIRGAMIEEVMCYFSINAARVAQTAGCSVDDVFARLEGLENTFPGQLKINAEGMVLLPHAQPLARMVARQLDHHALNEGSHSAAI
ncbi:MAG: oxygen-independent coproporphyrinogen III oxidase [Brevirhabdus sp.]